ncbi:MAG TPA: cytochrome d ubiquinol oxidase subunit II [Acidimicrobiales bacterium]|nr:cytochrome d ubiquinol oxidase subunit II [Acidimicrobiales bacterium]
MIIFVSAVLLLSVSMYALFGGADFGGGLWDLTAGGDRRGWAPRKLIDQSITPVWEANHMWLIFSLVIFWTVFPRGFADVMTAAALPIWLAVFGIVLRGAGFAFRKEVETLRWQRFLGAIFAFSSLVTPFFMGTVVGAVVAGEIPSSARESHLAVWTSATSLLMGFLFVTVCAYMAAVLLTREAIRRHDDRLRHYFARRAEVAAVVSGLLSIATLLEVRNADGAFYHGLTHRALPLVIVAGLCGLVALAMLLTGRMWGLRIISAIGVLAVVWGWGIAQYPVLLPKTTLTIDNSAASHATLVGIAVVFGLTVLLVGPAFMILFRLYGREALHSE